MKSLLMVAIIALSFAQPSFAAKTKKAAKKNGLGTDHSFSAADVRGRYQYPAGGTVTVENEKELVDLLGVRKHFKDRLNAETTRN